MGGASQHITLPTLYGQAVDQPHCAWSAGPHHLRSQPVYQCGHLPHLGGSAVCTGPAAKREWPWVPLIPPPSSRHGWSGQRWRTLMPHRPAEAAAEAKAAVAAAIAVAACDVCCWYGLHAGRKYMQGGGLLHCQVTKRTQPPAV
jgi:hypothetical protein